MKNTGKINTNRDRTVKTVKAMDREPKTPWRSPQIARRPWNPVFSSCHANTPGLLETAARFMIRFPSHRRKNSSARPY